MLAVEPGGLFILTHADGSFQLNLPNGNYTLTQTDPTWCRTVQYSLFHSRSTIRR
ncbi:MAG: hypothetical protein R2818_13275 [Flavobacteriales bacterium]